MALGTNIVRPPAEHCSMRGLFFRQQLGMGKQRPDGERGAKKDGTVRAVPYGEWTPPLYAQITFLQFPCLIVLIAYDPMALMAHSEMKRLEYSLLLLLVNLLYLLLLPAISPHLFPPSLYLLLI